MLNPLNYLSKFIKSSNQKELDRIAKIVEKVNSLENVIIENKAVSNKNKIIGFEVNKNITGGRIKENDDSMLKVDCVSLDNYFSEKSIKIDFC